MNDLKPEKRKILLHGSIEDVLFCRTEEKNLTEVSIENTAFSLGLGAIAASKEKALPHLGELVTCPGMAAVLPGDGIYKVVSSTNRLDRYFTPFNVIMEGMSSETLGGIETPSQDSVITARTFWESGIRKKQIQGVNTNLFGGIWFAEVSVFRSTCLRKPPIPKNAPSSGKAISDPENYDNWFSRDANHSFYGRVALIIGVAINTKNMLETGLGEKLNRIFYLHPDASTDNSEIMIHQHALVFKRMPLPVPGISVEDAVREWIKSGYLIDVKHVLDDSIFRNPVGAIMEYNDIQAI